jgi:uncharacterized protein YdbL (DUF1318 family)
MLPDDRGERLMRKSLWCLSLVALGVLAGCVTINVYFPKAAAEKAADQFVGSVIGPAAAGSSAKGASTPAPASSAPVRPESDGHGEPMAIRMLDLVVPAARAAEQPDLRIHTPEIDAIHARMRTRYRDTVRALLDNGWIGFTHDGLVAVHNPSAIPMANRAQVNSAVAADNRDRKLLYQAIAKANDHPEWTSKIRDIFAKIWIRKAHDGWYYQNAEGAWKRK